MSKEKQMIEEMAWDLCDIPKHPTIKSCEQCGNKHCHAMYYAERAYTAGYRKQEWISVEERLPEKNKTCLCTDGNYIGTVYYSGKFGFEDYAPFDKITHWMPLPKAPKMKGGAK